MDELNETCEDRHFGNHYLAGGLAYTIPGFILFGIAFLRLAEFRRLMH